MDLPDRDMNEVEARLSQWRPAAIGPDRDRTLYLAGRAASRSDGRFRLALGSSACLALVAATLGGLLVREHGRRAAVEMALAESTRSRPTPPVPVPSPPLGQPSPSSYLVLSHRPLEFDSLRQVAVETPSGEVRPAPTSLRVGDRSRFSGL